MINILLVLLQDLNLRDDFDREIVFDVVVEEEKTKRRQNNTNSIMVYKHPYKIELGKTIPVLTPESAD
jgi:hypothetical protein